MNYATDRAKVLAQLQDLHRDVDGQAEDLARHHRRRLQCRRGCHDCCVDGLTVFAVEAERIRRHHGPLLHEGQAAPEGGCAFLDAEGGCRIYADRPYVCRTQGLPLRWLEEGPAGTAVEYRDICPLNDGGPPLEEMEESLFWTLGVTEGRLAALQEAWGEGELERVPLRSLFRRGGRVRLPAADPG